MTYAQFLERLVALIQAWRADEMQEFPEPVLQKVLLVVGHDPAILAHNPRVTCTPEGDIRLRWWAEDAQRYEEIVIETAPCKKD